MAQKSLNSDTNYTRKFSLEAFCLTDVGKRRNENQDSYGFAHSKNTSLYLVADGMGGAKGGATASAIALEVITRLAFDSEGKISEKTLCDSIHKANQIISKHSADDQECEGMGTTLVALALVGKRVIIANVGDSRIYRLRSSKLERLTKDHSLLQELLDSGAATKDQIKDHPMGHILTRSLGPVDDLEVDVSTIDLKADDKFLLCSDGLLNHVSDEKIEKLFTENKSLKEIAEEGVRQALEDGGSDNVSLIVLSTSIASAIKYADEVEVEVVSEKSFSDYEIKSLLAGEDLNKSTEPSEESNIFEEVLQDEIELISEPLQQEENERKPALLFAVFFFAIIAAFFLLREQSLQNEFSEKSKSIAQANTKAKKVNPKKDKVVKLDPEKEEIQKRASSFKWQESKEALQPLGQEVGQQVAKKQVAKEAAAKIAADFINQESGKEALLLTEQERISIINSKNKIRENLNDLDLKLLMLNLKEQSEALAELDFLRGKARLIEKQIKQIKSEKKRAVSALQELSKPELELSTSKQLEFAKAHYKDNAVFSRVYLNYQESEKSYQLAIDNWQETPNDSQLASIMGAKGRDLKSAKEELFDYIGKYIKKSQQTLEDGIIQSELLILELNKELERHNRHIGFWSAFRPVPKQLRKSKRDELRKQREDFEHELAQFGLKISDEQEREIAESKIRDKLGF